MSSAMTLLSFAFLAKVGINFGLRGARAGGLAGDGFEAFEQVVGGLGEPLPVTKSRDHIDD